MTYLIVDANESCIPNGGVESVLKWNKANGNGGNEVNVDSLTFDGGDDPSLGGLRCRLQYNRPQTVSALGPWNRRTNTYRRYFDI